MPETRSKPLPTPHPDQPRGPELIRPSGMAAGRVPHPSAQSDPDSEDSVYDSVHDDVNQVLSQAVSEPDPALASSPMAEAASLPPRDDATIPSFLREKGKQPKTAEIFASMGPHEHTSAPRAAPSDLPGRPLSSSTPVQDEVFGGLDGGSSKEHRGSAESGSDDDNHLPEPRSTWFVVLLLAYSSAVTLGLVWVLWTGRSLRSGDKASANGSRAVDESVPRSVESKSQEPLPPIPFSNVTTLHKTVRIGDVEITPLEIDYGPLELLRSFNSDDYSHDFRREESSSLILKLRLTNVSSDHKFAPLDRGLIRDQNSALDRTYIATAGADKIGLFPLALDSEWAIPGQYFSVLSSRENVETLLASEPVSADRLQGELTWRIRLRVGPYRTDVLGVRFTRSDLHFDE
jgi:hypothetical protein